MVASRTLRNPGPFHLVDLPTSPPMTSIYNGNCQKNKNHELLTEGASGIRARLKRVGATIIFYYKLFSIYFFTMYKYSIILIKNNTKGKRNKGKDSFHIP